MAGNFYLVASQNISQGPIYYIAEGQFLLLLWTLWHNYLIRIGKNRILCNPFAAPSKWLLP
jgi:hypothetical protein